MVVCVQLLGSHSAGKPIFKKCNIGRFFRELFKYLTLESQYVIFDIENENYREICSNLLIGRHHRNKQTIS